MNNKDLEWTFGKPVAVEGKENRFVVQCRECKDFFNVPTRPLCGDCQIYMDICNHGVACTGCSPKLMLKWIQEGNLKKGDLPSEQLVAIQKMVWEKFNKEIYVNREGFIRIK